MASKPPITRDITSHRTSILCKGFPSGSRFSASEPDLYGMEGVGKIYEWYKSGKLISDDEVALFFDPVHFKPLSEPLVHIRHNLMIEALKRVRDIHEVTA